MSDRCGVGVPSFGMSNGGWEMQHSPYTPEGAIETAARFGRADRRRASVRRFGWLLLLAPMAVFLLATIAALISD